MKTQFAILWLLLLICLPVFETIGQNTQPIELLKPKEVLTNNDNDITNSYRDLGGEWTLTQKSDDRGGGDKQTLFQRISNRNKIKKNKLKFEFSLDPSSEQLSTKSAKSKNEVLYFEIPIGLMRTITSRGDYGNLYYIGLLSFTGISDKIDFSGAFGTIGWGRTKEDIQYYHEKWGDGSKTFGGSILTFDFGYNISPIKNIRFSPMIGCVLISSLGPRITDKEKYPGLEKYSIAENLIPQIGFDTYYFKSNHLMKSIIKLKYRYQPNLSLRGKFVKDVKITKHTITLGINFLTG